MATASSPLPHDITRPPMCSWRGLLIDSAHTFWPVPAVELLLTVMARYRLNVLHWHLTDNAGWRMHVPGYPMLTPIGGQFSQDPSNQHGDEGAPIRPGSRHPHPAHSSPGFYSDANIRHLINYAAKRDIRIIPEITIPSSAGAAIRAYPHLGNPGLAAANSCTDNTTLWPLPSTLSFIEAAFHQACTLFPSPIIHIGSAPADWGPWEADPALTRAKLTSGADIERLLIDRALSVLRFHGRRAAAWDTITRAYPTAPPGTIILSHRPGGAGRQAARSSGASWVLADSDLLSLGHTSHSPAHMHALYRDLTTTLTEGRLTGIEAVAWSSRVTTSDLFFHHILPQLLIIAEVAWHGERSLPWEAMTPLIEREMTQLQRTIPYWNPRRT